MRITSQISIMLATLLLITFVITGPAFSQGGVTIDENGNVIMNDGSGGIYVDTTGGVHIDGGKTGDDIYVDGGNVYLDSPGTNNDFLVNNGTVVTGGNYIDGGIIRVTNPGIYGNNYYDNDYYDYFDHDYYYDDDYYDYYDNDYIVYGRHRGRSNGPGELICPGYTFNRPVKISDITFHSNGYLEDNFWIEDKNHRPVYGGNYMDFIGKVLPAGTYYFYPSVSDRTIDAIIELFLDEY